jgi:DNA polymerase-3 subunit gamma/tau
MDDAPPPWMDEGMAYEPPLYEFPESAELAEVRQNASPPLAAPAPAPAPVAVVPFKPEPVAKLNWDGDWPALAATLPVRGVVQQLAQQSELIRVDTSQAVPVFQLKVAALTLASAGGSDEKLAAALSEHFGCAIRVEGKQGQVAHTANAASVAEREARQKHTEELFANDPFVQKLVREFGAAIMPGSVKPA